jgi:sterol 3beta-glucosyltransferase
MRVVIATYGTTGDVQPLLGLAAELCRRGHTIKFAAPPDFGSRVSGLGFDFVPLGPFMDLCELREIYGRASLTGNAVEFIRWTLPLAVRDSPRMVEELADACRQADVLISVPYQLAGRIVHDLTRIPLISVFLSPFGGFGRGFVAESARQINELRGQYGLESLIDPLGPDGSSSLLGLHAVSPKLFLRPRRWPEHHRMTGFFFLNEEWTPDPALARFMAAGEPPIVICFGSMLHQAPERLSETLQAAIALVGKRAVVQKGWSGLELSSTLPDTVRLVDFLPHQWLFPRAGCVVHAGGAGTTAATLRAGVPSVVVPHLLDQYLWATLLREQGCAADVIPYGELAAERLAGAIKQALTATSRTAAAAFSEIVSAENGVSTAVDLVEAQMQVSAC